MRRAGKRTSRSNPVAADLPAPKIKHKNKLRRFVGRVLRQPDDAALSRQSPIVVGAIGGSGTRAVLRVLVGAGVYMGTNLNRMGDSRDLSRFMTSELNAVLERTRGVNYALDDLPPSMLQPLSRKFMRAVRRHLAERPAGAGKWGWKLPRSLYALPLIKRHFPKFRFVHMLRDGRDLALSANDFQYRLHHAALTGRDGDSEAMRLQMWAQVNCEAAGWAAANLPPDRYHLLRFEDLCDNPTAELTGLFRWLGITAQIAPLAATIKRPPTLGRFAGKGDDADFARKTDEIKGALQRFGYVS